MKLTLGKSSNHTQTRIYGYDYWNYIGYSVFPCNKPEEQERYTWECVSMLGLCACGAGDRACTLGSPPEDCY
jgi:hypothetical protein